MTRPPNTRAATSPDTKNRKKLMKKTTSTSTSSTKNSGASTPPAPEDCAHTHSHSQTSTMGRRHTTATWLEHNHHHNHHRHHNHNHSHSHDTYSSSDLVQAKSKDEFWSSTSTTQERQKIREFWLELGEEDRRSLVKIEKEAVLRKMKEQQRHSCNCTVCGKKRTAIEDELEVLYDAYYEELEHFANHQHQHPAIDYQKLRKTELPSAAAAAAAAAAADEDGLFDFHSDSELSDFDDGADPAMTDQQRSTRKRGTDHFNFGNSLTVKGGILTVADDLLKNDGRKFLDMMERLAEKRIKKDEEISLDQAQDDYFEDEEDDDDDSYDETKSGQDSRTEEQRMEEGRRMFQIFAARMFEQRVLAAYREKVAHERQLRLIQELEEEEKLQQERELKKQKEREKKKDKKRQLKKQKEEERIAREAKRKAEEEAQRKAQLEKQEQERQKREQERLRREEERRQKEEDRLRREEQRKQRLKEERERLLEEERQQKEREESELAARLEQEELERRKQAIEVEKARREREFKEEMERRDRALKERKEQWEKECKSSKLRSLSTDSTPTTPSAATVSPHTSSNVSSSHTLDPLKRSKTVTRPTPIGQLPNGRLVSSSKVAAVHSPPPPPPATETDDERSLFSNFLFGRSHAMHPSAQPDATALRNSTPKAPNSHWTNGWTASAVLSEDIHGRLFGDVLPDRREQHHARLLEKMKAAYARLDTLFRRPFYLLDQMQRMLMEMHGDHVDARDIINAVAPPLECRKYNGSWVIMQHATSFIPYSSPSSSFTTATSMQPSPAFIPHVPVHISTDEV